MFSCPYYHALLFVPSPLQSTHIFVLQELSSDVGSNDESRDTKARQVLGRLQSGHYARYFANEVYRCPFCTTRSLGATDFNCVVRHVENIGSCNPRVGSSMNVNAHYAKHKALGIHLRKLQQVAIAEGRMAPIKTKMGSIRWHKRQRRDVAEARWREKSEARKREEAEARRG